MISMILRTTSRLLITLFLLFSIFLLVRGHNEPGGGFVGGLVAAGAFVLHAIAYDVRAARRALRVDPALLIPIGLLLAAGSGLPALFGGEPFMTARWGGIGGGVMHIELGTPLVFDVGVYLVVVGITLVIILSLAEE
jgi:multicomponent Na+:H+ antiporter subunit B